MPVTLPSPISQSFASPENRDLLVLAQTAETFHVLPSLLLNLDPAEFQLNVAAAARLWHLARRTDAALR